MKIGIITFENYENRTPGSVGSSRIRGDWVAKYNNEIEIFEPGREYDAIIYQKCYWREHLEEYQGIKIFDLCDPDWLDGRPVAEMLSVVDAVTTSTETLQSYVKKMTKTPVIHVPDRIDPNVHLPQKSFFSPKITSAVWFGYSQNSWILDAVVEILRQKRIQLVVVSDRNYMEADAFIKYDGAKVYEELIQHDIAILPHDSVHHRYRYKSNNKTLSAWALKLPVVKEPADLERLASKEARVEEAETRYNEVIKDHHVRQSGIEYIDIINQVKSRKGVSK